MNTSKQEEIRRISAACALEIATTVLRHPGPLGLVMALAINERAHRHAYDIAQYQPRPPSVVLAVVSPPTERVALPHIEGAVLFNDAACAHAHRDAQQHEDMRDNT